MTAISYAPVPGAPMPRTARTIQAAPTIQTLPAVATPQTRLRLTLRGRRVVAALVALPIVLLVGALVLNGGGAAAESGAAAPTVTVEAGQSLWTLAEELAPGAAIADVVADLIALNGLSEAYVFPGQVLVVPASYAD